MDANLVLLVGIIVGIAALMLGGLFAESISLIIRRFVQGFWYDGGTFLLWGLMLWTVVAMMAMVLVFVFKH